MKTKKYLVVGLLFFSTFSITNGLCQNGTKLWVTKDFKSPPIIEKNVIIKKRNVMEILDKNATIETAYGGGFVNSINGLVSGKAKGERKDWFYYINGIMAHVGALRYFPKKGDVIWWDYHEWDTGLYISAVIGAYPQPFLSSYGDNGESTVIYYTADLEKKAKLLKGSLVKQGVKGVRTEIFSPASILNYKKNLYIVIGPWSDLERHNFIKGIYDHYYKTGFLVRFEQNGIGVFNVKKEIYRTVEEAAAIIATKIGFGLDNPIWFITGTSNKAVKAACDVLIKNPDDIKFCSAAIVTEEDIINVPAQR